MANRSRKGQRPPDQIAGVHAVTEAIRAGRRRLDVLRVRRGDAVRGAESLLELARRAGVRVEPVASEQLIAIAGGEANAQGVVLEAGPLPEVPLTSLSAAGTKGQRMLVALDGVEDPQNVGAIARVAEAAGAGGLILTRRRSPPLSAAVSRASAGAIEWLPCSRVPNLPRALEELKQGGFWVFGSSPDATLDLYELPDRAITGDRIVVLGAEGRGVRRGVDRGVDFRIRIPLGGQVESLNVSSAAAIVLFELQRRSHLATASALATSV
jgi:23S rRNA (guanosine2251-2'-O)-methyltransferase